MLYINLNDVGRFGHQTFCILSGISLARLMGIEYFKPNYGGICKHWNNFIDFNGCEKEISINRSNIYYAIPNSNPLSNNISKNDIKPMLLNWFNSCKSTYEDKLVITPYDVFSESALVSNLLLERDFNQYFSSFICKDRTQNHKKVVNIHIRRGDFSANGPGANLYVKDSGYSLIFKVLDHYKKDIDKINIFSQGTVQDFYLMVKSSSPSLLDITEFSISDSFWTNDEEVHHFSMLAKADIVIGSCSSYSVLAMMCNKGNSIIIGPNGGLFQDHRLFFNNCSNPLLIDNHQLNSINPSDCKHINAYIQSFEYLFANN